MAALIRQTLVFPESKKIDNSMITLPSSVSEVKELFSSSLHHTGLNLVWKSYRAHRLTDKANIFLFGKSGAGKSSILNYLFGSDLISTSMFHSATRDVVEYGCSMESLHWKVDGLGIGFIDTPGFFDTSGINQDANNLAMISKFVNLHYAKREVCPRKLFPNIVLVVADATDKRFFALESDFSKVLHILSKLDVVDTKRPNVVIAITHALSLKKKMFTQRSEAIANGCRILSKLHLSVEAPVVFIENDDDEDELESEGDWKILPDGTRQPLNLFHTMIDLMKKSGDEIGIEAIRLFFANAKGFTLKKSNFINGDNTNFDKNDISYWSALAHKQSVIGSHNEIFEIIIQGYQGVPDLKLDEWQVITLAYNLKKAKVVTRSDIEGKYLVHIKQLIQPYEMSKDEVRLLCELFKLNAIGKLNYELLGFGYSRLTEKKKEKILIVNCKDLIWDKGVFVPENAYAEQCNAVSIDIQYKDDKGIRVSLSNLFSEVDKINLTIKFKIRYHLVKITIDDSKMILDPDFQLSLTYLLPSHNLKQKLFEFEMKYGFDVITKLHFGGTIEGCFVLRCSSDRNKIIKLAREVKILLETYFDNLQKGTILTESNTPLEIDMNLFKGIKEASLKWRGGDSRFHSKSIAELRVKQWRSWVGSLCDNVVLMDDVTENTPLIDILSSNSDEDMKQLSNYLSEHSVPQEDLNDLYFYTSTDVLTEAMLSLRRKDAEKIYTRVVASDCCKSKLSLCTIM